MALFESSTHKQHWILTTEQIEKCRVASNEAARTHMSNQFAGFDDDCLINLDEGLEIIKKMTLNLIKICQNEKYMSRVLWSAAIMYRRFYLNRSLMHNDNDPTLMMLTAIFVAGKAEEAPYTSSLRGINIGALCAKTNSKFSIEDIIKSEIIFLEGIEFHLIVFNPSRPLQGLLEQIQQTSSAWEEYVKECNEVILFSLLSDCSIQYPPAQIALSALLFSCDRMQEQGKTPPITKEEILDKFLYAHVEKTTQKAIDLVKVFETISKSLRSGSLPPQKNLYRSANKKLKKIKSIVELAEKRNKLTEENKNKILRKP
mmetsp:Transcript_14675/g.19251  ORF Transcript_14675/g.19251 Transcript_14675/m.19251 type:complete len:315 (+) Transcript_14675:204-1148(+)